MFKKINLMFLEVFSNLKQNKLKTIIFLSSLMTICFAMIVNYAVVPSINPDPYPWYLFFTYQTNFEIKHK